MTDIEAKKAELKARLAALETERPVGPKVNKCPRCGQVVAPLLDKCPNCGEMQPAFAVLFLVILVVVFTLAYQAGCFGG